MTDTRIEIAGIPADLVAAEATSAEAGELLVLQRCCWVDEAIANDTLGIPALRDSVADVEHAIADHHVINLRFQGRLIASVQAWAQAEVWHVGRLMVAPDFRGRGIARALLRHAMDLRPGEVERIEMYTGPASTDNIAFYVREGFEVDAARGTDDYVVLVRPV